MEELLAKAIEVRDENIPEENTAQRVGQVLVKFTEEMKEMSPKVDDSLNTLSVSYTADFVILETIDNLRQGKSIIIEAAKTTQAGMMVAEDKIKVDKIDAIETTAKGTFAYVYSEASADGFFATFSDNNETIEKEIHIPAATQTKAGVMSAADKYKLDAAIPSYTYSKTRAIRKGKWLQLARWSGTAASSTTFLLTLCQRLFAASIQFTIDLSDARGNIDLGAATGNLPFIDQIAVVNITGQKALLVRLCESLTNAASLPTLRLDTIGEGWKSPANNILIDAAEPAESSYIASVTPVFRKFSDVVTSPATNLTDGLMAAADKRKLDAIATYSQHLIESLNALAARVDKLEQGAATRTDEL